MGCCAQQAGEGNERERERARAGHPKCFPPSHDSEWPSSSALGMRSTIDDRAGRRGARMQMAGQSVPWIEDACVGAMDGPSHALALTPASILPSIPILHRLATIHPPPQSASIRSQRIRSSPHAARPRATAGPYAPTQARSRRAGASARAEGASERGGAPYHGWDDGSQKFDVAANHKHNHRTLRRFESPSLTRPHARFCPFRPSHRAPLPQPLNAP